MRIIWERNFVENVTGAEKWDINQPNVVSEFPASQRHTTTTIPTIFKIKRIKKLKIRVIFHKNVQHYFVPTVVPKDMIFQNVARKSEKKMEKVSKIW